MRPRFATRAVVAPFALAAGLCAVALIGAAPARARSVDDATLSDPLARLRAIKQSQRELLMGGARGHIAGVLAEIRWEAWKKRHPGASRRGVHARPSSDSEEGALPLDGQPLSRGAPRAAALSTLLFPTNVRCNNPAGDSAGAGQAEECIASFGQFVLVAWNDGQGFNTGGDVQNYGYSTDGGVTFIQPAGGIPHPAGTGFKWTSDPLVTVNEKTGEFFYSGLCDSAGGAFSGVGVVKATFPGGGAAPVWGTPHIARKVNASTLFMDKEWLAADSSNGNLYLTYTLFTVGEDSVEFQRSTDGGSTWGPIIICNSDSAAGWVQGSRPVPGINGQVYVTWVEVGQSVNFDHMRIRKSINAGVSFGPEIKVADEFTNFGTGAPGFNRQTGVTFPSITVDRTTGANRGRIYVAWNETVDWFDDPLGGGGNRSEVESNNTPGTATSFTIGQRLRGSIGNSTDLDYFSFSATQGTTYIFWCDSLRQNSGPNAGLEYTMRILCSDGSTRLALSGANANYPPPGAQGFIVWTAPTTDTYYLRMGYNGQTGGYRIQTGLDSPSGDDRARDQRDVLVAHSDDGTIWSTPTRVNDDVADFDDWLPEVAVAADGLPYVAWYDWRDASLDCGGDSRTYLSRSTDGGATWAASQAISTGSSPWTTVATNIAPNQGDYISLNANARFLHPSWADGRSGETDVNVWSTTVDTGFDLTTCAHDTTVATGPGASVALTFSWRNRNVVFPNDYTYKLTDDAGWVSGTPQVATLAANASKSVTYNVPVPSPSAPSDTMRFTVTNKSGSVSAQCVARVTVTGNVDVGPAAYTFDLRPAVPNPAPGSARIDFSLPEAGPVRLVIYGLAGERVRVLVDGARAAGPNSVMWDGRDDRGHAVHAGAYFYRLEGLGRSATRRLVMLP
jgi:hypothetical protein